MEMKKSNKRTQDFGGKSNRTYLWIECREWGNKSRVSLGFSIWEKIRPFTKMVNTHVVRRIVPFFLC